MVLALHPVLLMRNRRQANVVVWAQNQASLRAIIVVHNYPPPGNEPLNEIVVSCADPVKASSVAEGISFC